VALAARAGKGFGPSARDFAVAAELVHNATLLHDDVLDSGEMRRGAPTSRALYGNAASVLAGDWLLTEALRRVRHTKDAVVLDRLLDALGEMISAESIQLERRNRIDPDRNTYFRVIEGKTASLFRWALFAGARAGELKPDACEALEEFGLHLGTAFQMVDDVLDFAGHSGATGKRLFADLREGKMTLPLILGLERSDALAGLLQSVLEEPADAEVPEHLAQPVCAILEQTRAIEDTQTFARERAQRAMTSLERLPQSPATFALLSVSRAALSRES
jgi:octaprenyl-diphosphate synthase